MANDRPSRRNRPPSDADLRVASRRLLIDTSAALHRLFDAAVAALAPAAPARAPVIVHRDRRTR